MCAFLVSSSVLAPITKELETHSNVLIVRELECSYKVFVYDPFLPTAEAHNYVLMNYLRETVLFFKMTNEVRVIFGQQTNNNDCFHRALDFLSRLMHGKINLDEMDTFSYPITKKKGQRLEVPSNFWNVPVF